MNLTLSNKLVNQHTSLSQKIRVLSEAWMHSEIFCPNCGNLKVSSYENNKPVADFYYEKRKG